MLRQGMLLGVMALALLPAAAAGAPSTTIELCADWPEECREVVVPGAPLPGQPLVTQAVMGLATAPCVIGPHAVPAGDGEVRLCWFDGDGTVHWITRVVEARAAGHTVELTHSRFFFSRECNYQDQALALGVDDARPQLRIVETDCP